MNQHDEHYVTGIINAKTAEPIKMPFGSDGPHNHVLHGGPDPPEERAIFGVGKHGHARSVYKGAWICGATMRPFVKLL